MASEIDYKPVIGGLTLQEILTKVNFIKHEMEPGLTGNYNGYEFYIVDDTLQVTKNGAKGVELISVFTLENQF